MKFTRMLWCQSGEAFVALYFGRCQHAQCGCAAKILVFAASWVDMGRRKACVTIILHPPRPQIAGVDPVCAV